MKTFLTLIVLAGLVAAVSVVPAAAQATWNGARLDVKFTVPMPFYAGDKLMPPGKYQIKQGAGVQANTLLLRGAGKNDVFLAFTAVGSPAPVAKMNVTFNKYGDKEYLNSVEWPGGADTQGSWILTIEPSAGEQAAAKAAAASKHKVPGDN